MHHTGHLDVGEVRGLRLSAHHDWPGGLAELSSHGVRDLLQDHGIFAIGYRYFDAVGDRFDRQARFRAHAGNRQ